MQNWTADWMEGASVNKPTEKGSGVGTMLLIGLLFLPIHVGIFIFLGKNSWLPLELALIGAIIGVYRVWSENEDTKDKSKLLEMALLGLLQSFFLTVIVFGPLILLTNWLLRNIGHLPIPESEDPAWLRILFNLVGFELFYWLAIFLVPRIRAKSSGEKKGSDT